MFYFMERYQVTLSRKKLIWEIALEGTYHELKLKINYYYFNFLNHRLKSTEQY